MIFHHYAQFNLAWKLALVLKGLANPTLLNSYTTERFPVIAEMLNLTTTLYQRTFSGNSGLHTLLQRADATKADIDESAKDAGWYRDRKLFQLDVNYRWSEIVYDERFPDAETDERNAYGVEGQVVRAGDRAPDAPGLDCVHAKGVHAGSGKSKPTRLFDILEPNVHTALVFADRSASEHTHRLLRSLVAFPKQTLQTVLIIPIGIYKDVSSPDIDSTIHPKTLNYVFKDVEGYAFNGYGMTSTGSPPIVIIRPDAMVGLVAFSISGVERYVTKVFGGGKSAVLV